MTAILGMCEKFLAMCENGGGRSSKAKKPLMKWTTVENQLTAAFSEPRTGLSRSITEYATSAVVVIIMISRLMQVNLSSPYLESRAESLGVKVRVYHTLYSASSLKSLPVGATSCVAATGWHEKEYAAFPDFQCKVGILERRKYSHFDPRLSRNSLSLHDRLF
jgi:hypothetical protein